MVVHNKRVFELYKTLDLGRRFILLSLCQQKFFSANAEWVCTSIVILIIAICAYVLKFVSDVQDVSKSIRE